MNEHLGRPLQILLIDDSDSDVKLTMKALESTGVATEISHAKDGEQALAFLGRQGAYAHAPRPDLILLDLKLPRMSGREVLQRLKSDPVLMIIPVVALTANLDEEEILHAYRQHANCYVYKPVNFRQFLRIIRSITDFWLTVVELPPKEAEQKSHAPR